MKKTTIFSANEIAMLLTEEAVRRLRWEGKIETQISVWNVHEDADSNTIAVTLSDE